MKKNTIVWGLILALLVSACVLGGCEEPETPVKHTTTATQETKVEKSKFLAVITKVDTEYKNLSFYRLDEEEEAIYPYHGGTWFYSKSGAAIAANQIPPGAVVEIEYIVSSNKIEKVQLASDEKLMENTKVTNFAVRAESDENGTMRIGSDLLYTYDENTYVYSDGQRIGVNELINSTDQLHVWAYGTKIVSVIVDGGHGYLSLSGDSLFIGGLISVGGAVARNIESGMLLTVPEGNYKVEVSNGKYYGEKEVTIMRGEESVVDFSDVLAELTQVGNIRFTIKPSDAKLYIDGLQYEYDSIVSISAGRHNITVRADGYDTYSDTMEIDPEYQTITIDLTGDHDETTAETTAPSETDATTSTVESEKNTVTISGPIGGYVFFDGSYKGIAPVTFAMVTGEHEITIYHDLSIKSYTVNLAEGGDDVTYDFTDK